MKKKIILVLFILNYLLLLVYFLPLLHEISHIFFNSEAAAIGIIGGADGPTAIFITPKINWFPIVLAVLEIILGISLLISHSKK